MDAVEAALAEVMQGTAFHPPATVKKGVGVTP